MVIRAKTFEKLRDKLNSDIIGPYGTALGLGVDLEVRKYSFTTNEYGDRMDDVYVSSVFVKGIVVNSSDNTDSQVLDLNVRGGEQRLYVPVDTVVDDTADDHYKFVFDGNTFVLVFSNKIGNVANMGGVIKEITLKPKN